MGSESSNMSNEANDITLPRKASIANLHITRTDNEHT